jgi:DNA-binding MarR family transcriptional regulator
VGVTWLNDDEQTLWRRLLSVQTRIQERLDEELRETHDLSLAEYECLVHLSEAGPEGTRMSDLAAQLLLSKSGLTRRIDSMVKAGLVERRSCPADRRGQYATLTEAGAARLAEAAPTHVTAVRRYLIDTFGGDLAGLCEGLCRIEHVLGESRTGSR